MIPSARFRPIISGLLLAAFLTPALLAQSVAGYVGDWKQNNERSEPGRGGEVTLKIAFQDPKLTIDVTSARASSPPRHATQTYSLDGKQTTWTGADGDQFDTTAGMKGDSLLISVVEYEDGRTLRSTEIWTLMDNGKSLKRTRKREGKPSDTIVYDRQPAQGK